MTHVRTRAGSSADDIRVRTNTRNFRPSLYTNAHTLRCPVNIRRRLNKIYKLTFHIFKQIEPVSSCVYSLPSTCALDIRDFRVTGQAFTEVRPWSAKTGVLTRDVRLTFVNVNTGHVITSDLEPLRTRALEGSVRVDALVRTVRF